MSSPIKAADFGSAALTGSICEKLTALMGYGEKLSLFVGYLFDENGNPTQASLALSLPPPGVIVDYYNTITSFDTVSNIVQNLSRTQDDIDAGNAPFWRICDGTHGTPDLRGRFVLGAGAGAGLTSRGLGESGGEESHVLIEDELPAHTHGFPDGFSGIVGVSTTTGAQDGATVPNGLANFPETAPTGSGIAHNNMPPFKVLYKIMRTDRTS